MTLTSAETRRPGRLVGDTDGRLVISGSSQGVATTVTNGRQTVSSAGTAVALASTNACKWVTVTAIETNTSFVNVGPSTTIAAAGATQRGIPLRALDSVTLLVDDIAKVFVDARVNGEGVLFTYGT